MSYLDQMRGWLAENPKATREECYKAGYMQCTDNWCRQETFQKKSGKGEKHGDKDFIIGKQQVFSQRDLFD